MTGWVFGPIPFLCASGERSRGLSCDTLAAMPRVIRLADLEQFAAINLLSDPGYDNGPFVIPNCWRVVINWSLTDARVAHNILYGAHTGGGAPTGANAESIFNQITTGAVWTTLAGFLASTASITGVSILDVGSAQGIPVSSTGVAKPGTSASPALPDETAIVYTLRTAKSGPSGRGRAYIPGFATNALGTGGVVNAATVTAVGNWMGSAVGPAISSVVGPWSLGLPHRLAYTSPVTGREFPERPAQTVPVTAASGVRDNHWDSQRRRGLR